MPPTPERIMQFAWGYAPTLIIESAVRHGFFDMLAEAPKTAEQVAAQSVTSLRGVKAILNALVGLQLLARSGENYTLTPESDAFLVSSRPSFHGGFFRHMSTQLIPQWLGLTEIVRTGKPARSVNEHEKGAEFFAEFVEALFPMGYPAAQALGRHLDIAAAKAPLKVLDIAAGSGVWGIALAEQSLQVSLYAVDWPQVLEVTRKVAKRHEVDERLSTLPGDILKVDYGTGYNLALLGHILHSEGSERSRELLKKVFASLAPGGTLAIAEFMPNDDRSGPPDPLLFAVNMLINTGQGDAFTFAEMSAWLKEAGFVNPRKLDVPSVSPLLLATKP